MQRQVQIESSTTMARDYEIRKMHGVEHLEETMQYPYMYILPDDADWGSYTPSTIARPILIETPKDKGKIGTFPKNIKEHFWIRPGENDGDSWIATGVLDNGHYFLFTGGCDYTGFDCQGGMDVWVSKSWKNIIDHAMSETIYKIYVQQTKVPPKEGEEPWPKIPKENFLYSFRKQVCAHCGEEATMPNDFPDDGDLCADCYSTAVAGHRNKMTEKYKNLYKLGEKK